MLDALHVLSSLTILVTYIFHGTILIQFACTLCLVIHCNGQRCMNCIGPLQSMSGDVLH